MPDRPAAASPLLDPILGPIARALADVVRDTVREELRTIVREELARAAAPAAPSTSELMSPADTAKALGVKVATVREWIRSGYLPATRLGPAGRRYGVRPDDVNALLDGDRVNPARATDFDAEAAKILSFPPRAARSR